MKREEIIKILRDQVSIRSTKSCVQIADEILELLADEPAGEVDREVLLKLFKDFFTFHNDANEGYSGIDKLFNEWYESKQDKEQEIIKALSGEEIEDVQTFTSTEYPIEDYVVYDKEHSEKLEIRQAIIKAHTFEGKCTISKYRINQLLEGAVWYRDWVRG